MCLHSYQCGQLLGQKYGCSLRMSMVVICVTSIATVLDEIISVAKQSVAMLIFSDNASGRGINK